MHRVAGLHYESQAAVSAAKEVTATTTTRVALVSATGTGRKRILPALRASQTCTVTAVHARDRARVRELAEGFGVAHAYTDLDLMVAERQFDVAVVCSPPFMHVEQLAVLTKAGIPTLCEKPLALRESDALLIEKLAAASGTLVMVAHQLRHQNTYAEIKESIESGEIGRVKSAFFEWSFRMDEKAPNAGWKRDPGLGGASPLADAGVHCLDLAIGLFGPGVVTGASSPAGRAGRVREACDVLALHGDVQVAIRASWLYGPYSNQLLVSGTLGEISAPLFFTELSAPVVRICTEKGTRTVRQLPGNLYRQEVDDFAAAVSTPGFPAPGTSLQEATIACRMLDEARRLAQLVQCNIQVIVGLETEPELCRRIEIPRQT